MKRHPFLLYFLLLSIVLHSGCKRTVCFTVEDADYLNPRHSIQFRNCSEDADQYLWEFGDGESSTEAEPQHIYASPGNYEVKLTASFGNAEKLLRQTIQVQYAYIDKIIVVSISATKPNGDPWDPDGSGPDLILRGREPNSPIGSDFFSTLRVQNITTPYEISFANRTIDMEGLILTAEDVNEPLITDHDTICYAYKAYSAFTDGQIERVDCGNIVYEFHMSHH